jgi:hypothetical protein
MKLDHVESVAITEDVLAASLWTASGSRGLEQQDIPASQQMTLVRPVTFCNISISQPKC